MWGKKRYSWLKLAIASLIAIAFLVLVGWAFNIPFLTSVLPNLATMKANTALSFLLIGTALWQLKDEDTNSSKHRVAFVCAAIVLLVSVQIAGKTDDDFLPERAAEWASTDREVIDSGNPLMWEPLLVQGWGW
jgi:hypothetical protein